MRALADERHLRRPEPERARDGARTRRRRAARRTAAATSGATRVASTSCPASRSARAIVGDLLRASCPARTPPRAGPRAARGACRRARPAARRTGSCASRSSAASVAISPRRTASSSSRTRSRFTGLRARRCSRGTRAEAPGSRRRAASRTRAPPDVLSAAARRLDHARQHHVQRAELARAVEELALDVEQRVRAAARRHAHLQRRLGVGEDQLGQARQDAAAERVGDRRRGLRHQDVAELGQRRGGDLARRLRVAARAGGSPTRACAPTSAPPPARSGRRSDRRGCRSPTRRGGGSARARRRSARASGSCARPAARRRPPPSARRCARARAADRSRPRRCRRAFAHATWFRSSRNTGLPSPRIVRPASARTPASSSGTGFT